MATRAATRIRWPMPFKLEPCDTTLFGRSMHELDLHWDYEEPPGIVHNTFLAFVGDPPWAPGFVGVDWHTPEGELDGAVFDELYLFMSMRVRLIEHVPDRRSVGYIERWSLPIATRMVETIETDPLADGRTRLRFRIAYDIARVFEPMHPPVAAAFRWWFTTSFRGLERHLRSARASRMSSVA